MHREESETVGRTVVIVADEFLVRDHAVPLVEEFGLPPRIS
jgi:hypothetical protein